MGVNNTLSTAKKERIRKMDKKIKFSEQPMKAKIVYGLTVAILCVTAIVIGIVSAASQKDNTPDDGTTPPVTDDNTPGDESGNESGEENENKTPEKLTFVSPVVGEVSEMHSAEVPVFSDTLGEWRLHTGIDITADEGAEVFAAADGTVSRIYTDARMGKTVEITHDGGIVTRYSNLASATEVSVGESVKVGDKIGCIGDTAIVELAEEPHLHLEFLVNGVSVNPLDYISEESKEASLGITKV